MRLILPLIALLAAAPANSPYRSFSWDALAKGQAGSGLVRVTGRYMPYAEYTDLVRGVLTYGRFALRVEGSAFDWTPKPGENVEFWGLLESDEQGPLLRFHNGRPTRDTRRAPSPMPELTAGAQVRLKLRVSEAGSNPLPVATGVTEDGRSVMLPKDYAGPFGVVCLQGTVAPLGNNFALSEPTPCAKR
ncbi:hypothetical protein F0U60_04920 [Archangium minus]|uniref:Uncharacterized protein n=1 Tax=Archangium minus TaxID=83450 RepID=A0ABY9WJS1_9BACT|nr:hypothetical protein F0U61_04925 [Archangium violaceum]WNG43513.1 hypothetical protein F0U60_04920 [Archangium minus]